MKVTTITLKTSLSIAQFEHGEGRGLGGGGEGAVRTWKSPSMSTFFGPDCLAYTSSLNFKRSTGLLTVLTYFLALMSVSFLFEVKLDFHQIPHSYLKQERT